MIRFVSKLSTRINLFKLGMAAGAALFLSSQTNCTLTKTQTHEPQIVQAAPVSPTPEPPPTQTERIIHHSNLREAVASILNNNIKVIAFGEIHKDSASNLTSTLERFSQDVLPLLAENDIKDLVIEHIPAGEKAKEEIQAFAQTQELGPFLKDWFAYHPDYCGVFSVIRASSSLGITIHGSGAKDEEELRSHITSRGQLYNQRALNIIHSLLNEGKRVSAYFGALHNDIEPVGDPQVNFGRSLYWELGSKYVEVDIYLSDLIGVRHPISFLNLPVPDSEWQNSVPAEGVNLINFYLRNERFIIILPRSTEPIENRIPEQAPTCP